MRLLGLGGAVADLMIKPTSSPVFDSPDTWGLKYEDVQFTAEDGVTLRGWLVNPGQNRVIIQTHFGVQCSRCGWTPEDKGMLKMHPTRVEFLKHMKALAENGYTTLAFDLRHHGNSDSGTKEWIWDGQEEYKDVVAAVKYVSERPDYASARIGLLSLCMGSSATLHGYGRPGGLQGFPNIKAMIIVQPHYSGSFLQMYGVPKFIVTSAVENSTQRDGPDFSKSALGKVKDVTVPTLVMQNRNDPYYDEEYVTAVHEALPVEKEMLWTELAANRFAGYEFFGENPGKMLEWFGRHMQ